VKPKTQFLLAFGGGVGLVLAFILAISLYNNQRADELEAMAGDDATENAFVRAYSQRMGAPEGKVTIVEFFDPGCETCAAVAPHVKAILDAHPGRVQLVLRYVPLHQGADMAVKILEAARKQGKYWETLQLLFDTLPQWASHHHPAPERIWEFLPSLGLDMERLQADMNSMEITHILQQDMDDARSLGVRKTPTFFVNGKPLTSFGLQQLQTLVQAEVAVAYGP
jgi:protein-disulfide isomerase